MSRFSQIMKKGQPKVKFSSRKAELLMVLSAEQHRDIAKVISQWLSQDQIHLKEQKSDRRSR